MNSSRTRRRITSLGLTVLLGITLTLACAAAVSAQVVSDPRVAEFDPSPDHWDVLASGQPAVARYELEMYMVGASAPFTTMNMGKPSPDADGKIRYDFSTAVAGWPLPGGNYEARVGVVGPEGEALSDPSNPFTFTNGSSCTITLSATTWRVPASGGTYTVDVSTGAGCAWTVTSSLSWVTLWSAGGSGGGTAPFEVRANSSTSARTGSVTIGGQTLTLSQDGAPAPPATKTTPSVSWATPAAITQGTALSATQLNASASVAGAFAYSPAAGTVLATGTHTLTATFTPADTTLYNTATASTVLVVRAPRTTPAVSWATPAAITQGTALSATQLNASASVAGTFAYSPAAGTVLATGTHTLTATFTPADTTLYNTATASTVLVVRAPRTTPAVSWATPAAITQGTALSATQLNASASVAGAFAYSPAAGTVLATGTHTLTATFTPADTTLYNTATASTVLVVRAPRTTPAVSWATPAAITQGTALSAAQLNASASVAGAFAYSPAAGTVLATGTHTLTATFTPADTTLYNTATASTVLVVNAPAPAPKTTPTLSWAAPAAITQGTPLGSTQLNASASVAGVFAYTPAAGTVLATGTHTLTATFTPADTTRYSNATASTVLAVRAPRTTPTVSWATPAAITQGTPLGSTQLNASASVAGAFAYSPAAGTVLATGTHTLTATFTPADTTLYTNATASTSITVNAVNPVTHQLTVARPGGGTVNGAGINCGTGGRSCSVTMPAPMTLGLQAVSDAGYKFSGWSGDCTGTGTNFTLQLNGQKSCGATFEAVSSGTSPGGSTGSSTPTDSSSLPIGAPYALTLQQPTGGTVRAAGINCGATSRNCSVMMPGPMSIGLQATPDPGYVFLGWGGHCSGNSATFLSRSRVRALVPPASSQPARR